MNTSSLLGKIIEAKETQGGQLKENIEPWKLAIEFLLILGEKGVITTADAHKELMGWGYKSTGKLRELIYSLDESDYIELGRQKEMKSVQNIKLTKNGEKIIQPILDCINKEIEEITK